MANAGSNRGRAEKRVASKARPSAAAKPEPKTHAQTLAPATERTFVPKLSFRSVQAQRGDRALVSTANPDVTLLIDLGTQRVIATWDGFFASSATVMGERIIAVGRFRHAQPYLLYDVDPSGRREPRRLAIDVPGPDLHDILPIDDERVLLTPLTWGTHKRVPMVLVGDRMIDVELPEITAPSSRTVGGVAHGISSLRAFATVFPTSESPLIAWDERVFRLDGDRARALPIRGGAEPGGSFSFTRDDGSAIGLLSRHLVRVTADGELSLLAPDIDNIMQLARIAGGVVCRQGNPVEKDLAKIVWDDGGITSLSSAELGIPDCTDFSVTADGELVIWFGRRSFYVPISSLAAAPRMSPEKFRTQHARAVRARWRRMLTAAKKKAAPVALTKRYAELRTRQAVNHPEKGEGVVVYVLRATELDGQVGRGYVIAFEDGDYTHAWLDDKSAPRTERSSRMTGLVPSPFDEEIDRVRAGLRATRQ